MSLSPHSQHLCAAPSGAHWDNGIDAESFVDFYASKGWMVGQNKMKDWKACVRTWEKNNYHNNSVSAKPKEEDPYTDDFFDRIIERRREAKANETSADAGNMG